MENQFLILFTFFYISTNFAQNREVVNLWTEVPGETENKHEPLIIPHKGDAVTRITDVTNPLFEVFESEISKQNSMGIIICPGGGYEILAIDKEGYEIAKWFNKLGFTAFVLQYRVPGKQHGALQDIQRAIRIIRSNAEKWKLNPNKIGLLGFSAGASLSARASTRYNEKTYTPVDVIDSISCRPDFSTLIYPAFLDQGPNKTLTPELRIDKKTPPMFIFQTADDRHGNSALTLAEALRTFEIPVELHLLAKGGHGYGMRPGNSAAETWPILLEKWLKQFE